MASTTPIGSTSAGAPYPPPSNSSNGASPPPWQNRMLSTMSIVELEKAGVIKEDPVLRIERLEKTFNKYVVITCLAIGAIGTVFIITNETLKYFGHGIQI